MAGVAYNIDKVLKGKAELISFTNFPPHCMLGNSMVDQGAKFLDYLCDLRKDVKSRQFHVAISVAGDELSKEQLKEVAKEYMDAMGYGQQPYMVFFHKDTDNNHIHIVSSRVRMDRKLISDSNERKRSLDTIKRICKEKGYTPLVTKKEEAAKAIAEVLNWKFKHEKAIIPILQMYGLSARPDEHDPSLLNVYSGNRKVGVIEKSRIVQCTEAYKEGVSVKNRKLPSDERPEIFTRKSVLYSKLNDLASQGYKLEEIQALEDFRKMGFLIGHKVVKDKNDVEHHQWTVTDFVSKTRFDGADVGITIETLLRGPEYMLSQEHFQKLVDQILSEEGPRCSWSRMKHRLEEMGIKLRRSANATSFSIDGKFHVYINKDQAKDLLYWERVESARKFKIHNQNEAKVLAALHSVKLLDVIPKEYEPVDDLAYQTVVDTLRGQFQTFFQAREQIMLLNEKMEKSPKKELSDKDKQTLKALKSAMNAAFSDKNTRAEAIVKDGDQYFFFTNQVGIVDLEEIVGRALTEEEIKALHRPIIDLAVITRSQGRWVRYIDQIIEEGGSEEVEKTQNKSGQQRGKELDDARQEERQRKQQEWELKKAAMEARRRSYTGPKPGSVRAAGKKEAEGGSPLMRNAMRPTFLDAILKVCHDMRHISGGGVAVTGGRSRKRKRGDEDDDDDE